jgi:hypothetical protein
MHRLSAGRDDHIEIALRQLARQRLQAIQPAFRPKIVDRDIAPLDQPIIDQAAPELLDLPRINRGGLVAPR